jgi:hypothetical protein
VIKHSLEYRKYLQWEDIVHRSYSTYIEPTQTWVPEKGLPRKMRAWTVLAAVVARASATGQPAVGRLPAATPLAQNLGDVAIASAQSFAWIGGVGYVVSLRNGRVAAWQTAQRWGKISAGFSGGRALGQVLRRADDRIAAVIGAAAGGVAAASSVAEMPSSVATFVGFTLLFEILGPGAMTASADGGPDKTRPSLRESAREKARRDYARRHQGDATRLKALDHRGTNIFGECVSDTVRKGGQLEKLGAHLSTKAN